MSHNNRDRNSEFYKVKNIRERKKLICLIDELLYFTDIEMRRQLFNLMASFMGPESISDFFYEEGGGIRILYDNIQNLLLQDMLEFLTKKCEKYKIIL